MSAKIAYINYYYDSDISESDYFTRYPSIHGWCKALADKNLNVTVYQRFNENSVFKIDNVSYILINDKKYYSLKFLQNPVNFHKQIIQDKPDVIHINSFNYVFQAFILKRKLPSSKIIIQHHAEKHWKGIKIFLQKYFSMFADGFIFSSGEIYEDWIKSNSIPGNKNFAEIIEGSTYFVRADRSKARSKTGLYGNPVFLWVGRLNDNKDPLTVIAGFRLLLNDFPEAKLYMIYSENDLVQNILSLVNKQSGLKDSVKLLGKVDHSVIKDYYNSSDYFVLGSHYEGSGYSLIEAIACGVVPIVTNIPSFKTIIFKGKTGGVWERESAESFYQTAKKILALPLDSESEKAAAFFKTNLSYETISRNTKEFYERLLKEK